jgi:hypothetical protein
VFGVEEESYVTVSASLAALLSTVLSLGLVSASAQSVTLSTASLSFGNQVVSTTSIAKTVTLKNGQTVALSISSIASSLSDYRATGNCPISPATLNAGASCTISVTFSPVALGSRPASLAITDSASTSPQLVSLSGTGIAPVTATPASLSFGNQAIGLTSASKVVTIKNNQSVALTIASVTTNLADYSTTTTCPLNPSALSAGSTCTVSVFFTPAVTGTRTATLTIADDANTSPGPTVSLTGTGIVPVVASPATLSFGNQLTGTTSGSQPVTLTNNRTSPLTIFGITSSLGDFVVTSTCPRSPSTLAGGSSCTSSVVFSPKATGTRSGTLSFKDNASNSPQQVSLSGTGLAPTLVSIAITPSPLSIPLGKTRQFTAVGTYSDASTKYLTNAVTWTSSTPAVATISASGFLSTLSKGTTTVIAALGTVSATSKVTVTAPVLSSLAVTPSNVSISTGLTQQFTATGTYTDGSQQNLTNSVIWSTSAPGIASINSTGLAKGLAAGSVSIIATSGSMSSSVNLTVGQPALVSVAITPANVSFALGTVQQLKATGTYTDGSTLDLTSAVSWAVIDAGIATVNGQGLLSSVAVGSSTLNATSGAVTGSTTFNVTPDVLVSIAVTPAIPVIPLGVTQQFTATGTFTSGKTQNLTQTVQWSSDTPATASISNVAGTQGLATSAGTGSATISATSGTITGATTLTVTAAALISIAVTPANPSIALGTTQQFTATGSFTDGTQKDVTAAAMWASDTPATAGINNTGLAASPNVGTATISATSGTVSGSTMLTVTPAVLVSIVITPATASIALGTAQAFTATGTYTDGTTQDVTHSGHWSSSDATVATTSNSAPTQGVASTVGTGAATISITADTVTASASLTVTPAVLASITLQPPTPSIALGTTQQFTATGTYTDRTIQDVTSTVQWSSSSATVAIVDTAGLATSAGVGTATIAASIGSISSSTTLTVQAPALVSIAVTPLVSSLPVGLTQQFQATGTYTDASTQDITSSVSWSSDASSVATIGATGLALAIAVGTANISASSGAITGSTALPVSPPVLLSLYLSPTGITIPRGTGQSFTALGKYSDGSTLDMSSAVAWSSTVPDIASINAAGLATGMNIGSAVISATSGSITGSVILTVGQPLLVSIAVTPANVSFPLGTSQQLKATGTYTDSSALDLTSSVSWTAVNIGIATVNSQGLVRSAAVGSSSVIATSGTITGSAILNVTPAVLVSIAITPAMPVIPLGVTQQFTATGTFTDSSTLNLTQTVQWSSAPLANASISNVAGMQGLATTAGTGSATISATSGTITGATTLTVTAAALVSIAIAPTNPSIALGIPQPFVATGWFTDGTTKDVTATATWASDTPATATVSNAGLATTFNTGTATISATSGTVSGASMLTVAPATLVSIAVSPSSTSILLGTTQQFAATGTYTDGGTKNLTNSVLWSSSTPSLASITATGLATGTGVGNVNVNVTSAAIAGAATLVIQQPPLVSIAIAPANASFALGATQQLTATGTYVGGSTLDITSSVTWSQTNNAVVTINPNGLAAGLGIGNTTVNATSASISASTPIAVHLGPVPPSFFGMQFKSPTSQVTVPYGRCRIWDAVSGTHWADIEPSPGVFQFSTMDGILAAVKQAGIDDGCIFTFGYFPQWASTNPTDNTCEMFSNTTGSCWPPADLNFDGSGTDQIVVDAITAIAQHVNDPTYLQTHAHIKYWEPFNEPYRSSTLSGTLCTTTHTCSFNGSYAQLVRMTEDIRCIVKGTGQVNGVPCARGAIDPTASISTPSGQSYFQTNGRLVVANFLRCNQSPRPGSGCTTGSRGSAATDVVNFHCYIFTGNADDSTGNIAASRAFLSPADAAKPFLCGEGGWGTATNLPDQDLQAGFVARWFVGIVLSQQTTGAMWYSWDNQNWGTLWNLKGKNGCTQTSGCMTKAGVAYSQTYAWLVGSTLQGCQSASGISTCTLTRPNGYTALMVWSTATLTSCTGQSSSEVCGSTTYQVPAGYVTKRDLDGLTQPANTSEYVGAKPILLENR